MNIMILKDFLMKQKNNQLNQFEEALKNRKSC